MIFTGEGFFMQYLTHMTFKIALAGVVLAGTICMTGCNGSKEKANADDSDGSTTIGSSNGMDSAGGTGNSNATSAQPQQPVKPAMPVVKLTEALDKTCLVKVGDMMPEVTLAKLDGQAVSLRDLSGQKLTVVCFWKANHPYSVEELGQLQTDIVEPYGAKGVQVIAINEDDPINVASNVFRGKKVTYPCLLDPRGTYFAKVATEELPRTYLLDTEGKILWFDIGSSRSTRRGLEQGIRFILEPTE